MSEAIIDITTREERPQEDSPHTPEAEKSEADKFVLRVLSGEQAGAQIPLRAKRYKIGSDEDCDIVLIGEQISECHVDMFFDENCLSILRTHAPVHLEQKLISTLPVDLEPMQIFTLGNIALAFGPENGDWPDQDWIDELVDISAVSSLNPPSPAAETALMPAPQHDNLPALSLNIFRKKLGLHKTENLVKLAFIAGLTFSLGTIIVAFIIHSTEEPVSIAHSAADRLHTHMQSDPAFAHIQLINTMPKKQLTGYVMQTADLNRLRHLTRGAHTDLNVLSVEKLDKSLNIITQLYGAHLNYKLMPDKGRNINLLLYGTVASDNARTKIREQIKHDLPTLSQIETNIITQGEAMHDISTWLAQHPNFSSLSPKLHKKGLTIEGNLLGNFRGDWQQAMQANPPRLPHDMLPFFDVRFGPTFQARIVSLVTGKNAQIRLVYDNQSLQNEIAAKAGDRLKGGFTLKKIAHDHLMLQWRGRDFTYHIPN